jgi:hypothetical protein
MNQLMGESLKITGNPMDSMPDCFERTGGKDSFGCVISGRL